MEIRKYEKSVVTNKYYKFMSVHVSQSAKNASVKDFLVIFLDLVVEAAPAQTC